MADKANLAARARVVREVVRSYFYVLLWMSISISVILFNKWLLAYSGFPFPISLTLWHMAFCTVVGTLAVRVFKVVKSHNMTRRDYIRRVMPIGMLYAGSLWLSNSAYLYLSVSFIQMTKSLMPGLVFASGVFLGTEKFSRGTTLNMLLIAFGVLVCALGEQNLVFKGLVQQLASLQFEAMRLAMVQVLMNSKGLAMNPMQSLYYVSPACFICLFAPFLSVELPHLMTHSDWSFNPSIMLANALTAFVLNLAVFLLIGKTSALTMNIAGVIKDWMLIFFSYYLFKAPLTRLNLAGYVFCCSGVFVYQYMRLQTVRASAA
ncbi:triose-phosphate transporter family-domain-containing protein [Dunaliella salina]|uniref:Triose-phosphate transporter family-domain-containing protein n=1 Tax=Dunaliella salina TaxID=3046 RepID=A0ABQ7GK48_DUNSA|nr:triose-phosphate transporter family-domain-containing protein [Dunaliella salina]|eukprot:KAF5834994.1 triose-phosphate transporter family-domain-containing protein [Dunaliella salina]